MNVASIRQSKAKFEVLQTTARSQTAVMILAPGGESSQEPNVHEKSDQVLLVVEGEVEAEVEGKKRLLRAGEVCLVPAGAKHRFMNVGHQSALTFNVYAPPEYPPGEKE